jgi:hypothetical protein
MISSGMPQLTDRYQWNWTPGFSWWLRDSAGHWHVATAGEPLTLDDGLQAFRLRLTPPLATLPDAVEVEVTGPAARARATVPVKPVTNMQLAPLSFRWGTGWGSVSQLRPGRCRPPQRNGLVTWTPP